MGRGLSWVRSEWESLALDCAHAAPGGGDCRSPPCSATSSKFSALLSSHPAMSGSPLFRLLNRNKGTQTLVTWGDAGAAVRMGQQGGQTEALWTHLDPSKPQERLHARADAHARSAATCHSHRTRATAAMANSPWRGSVLLRWFYCT